MPLYEAQCDKCGAVVDYHRRIADALETPECPRCGGQTRKVILSAPTSFVKGRFAPFKSVVDGSIIASERDMQEHNKRNNVVNVADGFSEDAVLAGNFGRKEEKLDKKELARDIGESIHMLENGYKPNIEVQDE